jgi:hypothetical protein
MFYNTIKAAWLAGNVTLRLVKHNPDTVIINANRLLAFKAMLLSSIERRLLAEFAQFDPAFIAGLPKDSEDWSREQRKLVVSAIHREGIPRFPASVAKLMAELPQHRYLS